MSSNYNKSRACITYGECCCSNSKDCVECSSNSTCTLQPGQSAIAVISDPGGGNFLNPDDNNAIYIQEWSTGATLGVDFNNKILYNPYNNQDSYVKNTKENAFKKTTIWLAKIRAATSDDVGLMWYTDPTPILCGDWIVIYTKDSIIEDSSDGPFFLKADDSGGYLDYKPYSHAIDTNQNYIKERAFIFQILYGPDYRLNIPLTQGQPFFLWSWRPGPDKTPDDILLADFTTQIAINGDDRGLVGVTNTHQHSVFIQVGDKQLLWGLRLTLNSRSEFTNNDELGSGIGTDYSSSFNWPNTGEFTDEDEIFEYQSTDGHIRSKDFPPYFSLFFTANGTDNCLTLVSSGEALQDYVCLNSSDCFSALTGNTSQFCSGCCCWDPSQFLSGNRYNTMENCISSCTTTLPPIPIVNSNLTNVKGGIYVCNAGKCVYDDGSYSKNYPRFTQFNCGNACNTNFECINGECQPVKGQRSSNSIIYPGDPYCEGKCKSAAMYRCINGECEKIGSSSNINSIKATFDPQCNYMCKNLIKNKNNSLSSFNISKDNWVGHIEQWMTSQVNFGKFTIPKWVIVILIFFIVFIVLYFWQRRREKKND